MVLPPTYTAAPTREWGSTKGRVSLSLPTLLLGLVAVVATSVTLSLAMSGSGATSTTTKFMPSGAGINGHRSVQMMAGKKASSGPEYGESRFTFAPKEAPPAEFFGEDAGVLNPVGYLDPFGFGARASPERLRYFREAELKHGRIAMLAALGFLTAENPGLKDAFFPGKGSDLAINALTDHNLDRQWITFVLGVGALELQFFDKFENILDWRLKEDYDVGDLGFDPLGLKETPGLGDIRTKELQNGRLAMLALAGFNAQELTDHKPILPIHGLGSASAAELSEFQGHMEKGLELVKEMGQMLMETSPLTH